MNPIEAMARALDPQAWADDLPIPTRAHTIAFHAGRAKSIVQARAALTALSENITPEMVEAGADEIGQAADDIYGCSWRGLADRIIRSALAAAMKEQG